MQLLLLLINIVTSKVLKEMVMFLVRLVLILSMKCILRIIFYIIKLKSLSDLVEIFIYF